MSHSLESVVYQLKVVLLGISPMTWRRLLIHGDSTIADLHYILQIVMGWTDSHLHQFTIHGKRYGIAQPGGVWFSDDPRQVKLSDFCFREQEKFLYEYDFGDSWQHQIRVEAIVSSEPNQDYPICVGGKRSAPGEDCGGAWQFMVQRQEYSVFYTTDRLLEIFSDVLEQGTEAIADYQEEVHTLQKWLILDHFDRHRANRCLKQYANGDEAWMFTD